jgi:RNA polymerase sigma-70 factor (ECF subfamily)
VANTESIMPLTSGSPSSSNPSGSFGELVRRAKGGEEAAAELLFSRYRPYLRVICALQLPRLCQRREDASDIVQHTLVDAMQGLSEFRGETEVAFEAWTARLLERNILQSMRRHTAEKRDIRRETIDWDPLDSAQLVWHSIAGTGTSPESMIFRGEAALDLALALEKLPEDQRLAVELRYLGQQPLQAIAKYMAKTTGAVAGLIRRGVENLRDVLPPQLGELSL